MAEVTTWIDVADNAVKIGLGALLGGGFGILVAWLNSKSESRKALEDRRRLILEGVLESVDGAANSASVFWAILGNAVDKRDKQQRVSDAEMTQLKELELKFFSAFTSLNSSGAKLLLLGEKNVEAKLVDLRSSCDAFFAKAAVDEQGCTREFLNEHKSKISSARRSFYEALSGAYGRDA